MNPIAYPARFELQPEGGYFVQFLDLENAFTQGDDLSHAELMATEVLTLVLDDLLQEGKPIPLPTQGVIESTVHNIAPEPPVQSALMIHFARGDKSLAELARAMGTSWPAVARLENPRHWPNLRQLDKAARALGKKLVLSLE
jgi:antitoxin HicB